MSTLEIVSAIAGSSVLTGLITAMIAYFTTRRSQTLSADEKKRELDLTAQSKAQELNVVAATKASELNFTADQKAKELIITFEEKSREVWVKLLAEEKAEKLRLLGDERADNIAYDRRVVELTNKNEMLIAQVSRLEVQLAHVQADLTILRNLMESHFKDCPAADRASMIFIKQTLDERVAEEAKAKLAKEKEVKTDPNPNK